MSRLIGFCSLVYSLWLVSHGQQWAAAFMLLCGLILIVPEKREEQQQR